ncbi:hypothetical protein T02_4994 [Trichinella nativa]|uniref:Uncharacterized protein n=1 Tax=Trichinella nativa TaxID=6335 RepID=A0A0V1KLS9_9BILA|nr:hypothetical protein T02_4994 [Trichinella nativa]
MSAGCAVNSSSNNSKATARTESNRSVTARHYCHEDVLVDVLPQSPTLLDSLTTELPVALAT